MKRMKILAMLRALTLLGFACSAAAVTEPEVGMGLAIPLAEIPQGSGFTDIPPGACYGEAAVWRREQGAMTRATMADALYRATSSPEVAVAVFPDIPAGSAYASAASSTSANGVMSDCSDGSFGADDPVNRRRCGRGLCG